MNFMRSSEHLPKTEDYTILTFATFLLRETMKRDMTTILIRREGDSGRVIFISRGGELSYEPSLNNKDLRRLVNVFAHQARIEPTRMCREPCEAMFRVTPGQENGFTRNTIYRFKSVPDYGEDGVVCKITVVSSDGLISPALSNFESSEVDGLFEKESLPLEDRALDELQKRRGEIKAHLGDEFLNRLRTLTGVKDISISEVNEALLAEIDGISFVADVDKEALTLDAAITGISMIGTCPWCKEETQSIQLNSFLDLAKNIESFVPSCKHFCDSRPIELF